MHLRAPSTLLAIALLLAGCGQHRSQQYVSTRVSYEEALEACDLEGYQPGDLPWSGSDGRPAAPISEECATVLGLALGLDWWSIDEEPTAFEHADTLGQRLVGAMHFLLIERLHEAGAPYATQAGVLSGWEERLGNVGDEPGAPTFNELVFEMVERAIETTTFEYEATYSWRARYLGSTKTMTVNTYSGIGTDPLIAVASTLVHEAAHAYSVSHVSCGEDGVYCDDDPHAANGAQAEVVDRWYCHSAPHDDWEVSDLYRYELEWTCDKIWDISGFSPCEDPCFLQGTQ